MAEPVYGPGVGGGTVPDPNKLVEELRELTKEQTAAPVDVDPWAHRSEGMRCRTCMWFVLKGTGDHRGALGRCRRRAPTMSGFPVVFETDWCGDHKLTEVA